MQDKLSRWLAKDEIDYRLLVPMLLLAFGCQVFISLIRVTTSYRIVEIGLSEIWIGIIAGAYAIVPIFMAVWVGRYVDRGNDCTAAKIGSWIFVASAAGFYFTPAGAYHMLAANILMGVAFLFNAIALQVICVRTATAITSREAVIGHYMVANALGQGLGPLMVSWVGGSARIPPTEPLFGLAVIVALLCLPVAYSIRPDPDAAGRTSSAPRPSISDLLHIPGLPTMMVASIIIITAQDLISIYLPLWGTERGVSVAVVGLMLATRSIASVISRLLYTPIVRLVGRVRLTVLTMASAALAYALIAVPVPLFIVFIAIAFSGFGLGIAATLSISNTVGLAPAYVRGTVLSLRITGNRVGQIIMPLMAGMVAAAAGAGGIFVVVGILLAASAASVQAARQKIEAAGR
ncbi:MAG: MFS transporter [Hyphomicrobiaceae bacterium]